MLLIVEVIVRPLHKMPVWSLVLTIMCMASVLIQVLVLFWHVMMLEWLQTTKSLKVWTLWLFAWFVEFGSDMV